MQSGRVAESLRCVPFEGQDHVSGEEEVQRLLKRSGLDVAIDGHMYM